MMKLLLRLKAADGLSPSSVAATFPNLKKKLIAALLIAAVFIAVFSPLFIANERAYAADPTWLMGPSGYISGQVGLDAVVDIIQDYNTSFNMFRYSCSPNWGAQAHPYNSSIVSYLLATIPGVVVIVDRTHLYPPNENSALDARNHWTSGVVGGVYEVLEDFPNNTQVYVEIINEYVSSDFDTRMQAVITQVRNDRYTNYLVADRMWPFSWTPWTDSLNRTFQGFHQYMNERSLSQAISRMQDARDAGITKIMNTETGAHFSEYGSFTPALVDSLEAFYDWCYALDDPIFNCLWLREDDENWDTGAQGYFHLGLTLPTMPPPAVEPPSTLPPYLLSKLVSTQTEYQTATFSANWNASEGLDYGWMYHNKTGSWENVTQELDGSTQDTFTTTVVLPEVGFCFGYYFGANDTLGNSTTSDTYIFTVISGETGIPTGVPRVLFPSGMTLSIPADRTVYFGAVKVSTTNTAMHINKFFEDSWFNYTVDASGVQTIYNGTEPEQVIIDGHQYPESNGWTFADSTVTVSIATSDVHIHWGETITPATDKDENPDNTPGGLNTQGVLFKCYSGARPASGAEITVYEVAGNVLQGHYLTDVNGEVEANIYPGSYSYEAVYQGKRVTGDFFHVEAETIRIDFATGETSTTRGIDRSLLLRYLLVAGIVVLGVLGMLAVTKNRRLRI